MKLMLTRPSDRGRLHRGRQGAPRMTPPELLRLGRAYCGTVPLVYVSVVLAASDRTTIVE
jgi:hypothetical protein